MDTSTLRSAWTAVWSLSPVVDGFYGCGSGAEWSNRALIEILAEVLPVEIDLVVLPVRVDAVNDHWQPEWRRAVAEMLGRSGRRVEVRVLEAAGVSLLGRLRGYKKTFGFARAYLQLSPVPTSGTGLYGTGLYGTGLDQGRWRTVQPWDDPRAVEELLAALDESGYGARAPAP